MREVMHFLLLARNHADGPDAVGGVVTRDVSRNRGRGPGRKRTRATQHEVAKHNTLASYIDLL